MTNYQIIRQIGKGGSGVVYLAWHNNLKKYVVLKQLIVGTADTAFLRHEVDLLKNLHHTYLPQVYDFFEMDRKYFLVEDYIQGEDLEHLLKRGARFSETQLTVWLKQLCQVLQYLHTRQPPIIHSDIKPANIMICASGDVCLIDFNIAVCGAQKGLVRGCTRDYAPPEQIALTRAYLYHRDPGRLCLDPSSDLYSLAATFYALMTGRAPAAQERKNLAEMDELGYSLPFRRLLDRAMRPLPAQRYRSAKEMEHGLNQLEKLTRRYRIYWWTRLAVTLAGMVLLASGVLMIHGGIQENAYQQYRSSYLALEADYTVSGVTADMLPTLEQLLEEEQFAQIRSNRPEETAQLFAMEAEYYFRQETAAGYGNAANYYEQALKWGEGTAQSKKYALNYALSLALLGDRERAQAVAADYLTGMDAQAVQAELYYYDGQDDAVLDLAARAADSREDQAALLSLYRTACRSAQRLGRWMDAVAWQERACELDRGDEMRRELAVLYLRAGDAEQDAAYYQYASDIYASLSFPAAEDQVNQALAEYELRHYRQSLQILQNVEPGTPALLCRSLFYQARNESELGKIEQAKRLCQKALDQYASLTEQQRQSVDGSGLFDLADQLGVE